MQLARVGNFVARLIPGRSAAKNSATLVNSVPHTPTPLPTSAAAHSVWTPSRLWGPAAALSAVGCESAAANYALVGGVTIFFGLAIVSWLRRGANAEAAQPKASALAEALKAQCALTPAEWTAFIHSTRSESHPDSPWFRITLKGLESGPGSSEYAHKFLFHAGSETGVESNAQYFDRAKAPELVATLLAFLSDRVVPEGGRRLIFRMDHPREWPKPTVLIQQLEPNEECERVLQSAQELARTAARSQERESDLIARLNA